MWLVQYPEYLLPLEFDGLCHNTLLELSATTKQLPLPNLFSSWGLVDTYCLEVQGLCTLPSKAKETITEIKSNFSNEEAQNLCSGKWPNHNQGREGWIQLSQNRTTPFFPLLQIIYLPRTVKSAFLVPVLPWLSTYKN